MSITVLMRKTPQGRWPWAPHCVAGMWEVQAFQNKGWSAAPWKSHLQYGDVPREALHCLVQLPALQPLLCSQIMEVLMESHRWERDRGTGVESAFMTGIHGGLWNRKAAVRRLGDRPVVSARKHVRANQPWHTRASVSQSPAAAEGLCAWRRIPPFVLYICSVMMPYSSRWSSRLKKQVSDANFSTDLRCEVILYQHLSIQWQYPICGR